MNTQFIHKYNLYLLISSMCLYLVMFTGSLSPIYFIYILAFLFSMLTIQYRIQWDMTYDVIIVLCTLLYILILLTISISIFNVVPSEYINYLLAGWSYIYIRIIHRNFSLEQFIKIFYVGIRVSLLLLSFETFYRVTHPVTIDQRPGMIMRLAVNTGDWFYKYKINSPFFADSNTTGACLLILLFSVYILFKGDLITKVQYKQTTLVGVLLLVLTFSRAACISVLIGYLICYINKLDRITRVFIYSFISILVLIIVLFATFTVTDGSFESKFTIIHLMIGLMLDHSNLQQILFGYFSNPAEAIGMYTHLFFLTIYFYTGVVGVFLYILFFGVYMYNYSYIIIIPFLILGLSYMTYIGTPYMYVPFAFIASIIDKQLYNGNNI